MGGKKCITLIPPPPPSFILLSCTLGTINVAKFAERGGGVFFLAFHVQYKRNVFFSSYFLIFFVPIS